MRPLNGKTPSASNTIHPKLTFPSLSLKIISVVWAFSPASLFAGSSTKAG